MPGKDYADLREFGRKLQRRKGVNNVATATAKAKATTPKKGKVAPIGRRSEMFGGKKIKKLAEENPFKPGSLIAKAYKLMRDGMTYEEYLAAGGRRIDLADAVKQGKVKLVK